MPFMPMDHNRCDRNLYCLWVACRFMICSSTQTRKSCYECFNFSCLRSGSPTLHSGNRPSPTECMSSIFVILKLIALIKKLRYMAASKQASKHTHAREQCSPASVGLAQARPNNGSHRRVNTLQAVFLGQ